MSAADALVVSLRRVADELIAERTLREPDTALSRVVEAAVRLVPGADAGGISMVDEGRVTSHDPTTPDVTKLDQLQSELQEGPCITALHDPAEDGVVLADDLAGADAARWPRFSPHAVRAGYRSMLSTQLAIADGVRAALNLYAPSPFAFDEEARRTAAFFGVQAATLLHGSRRVGQLRQGMESRDVIGQAKGILIERFGVDDAEAFQMLVRASQDSQLKLVKVAEWLQQETVAKNTAGPRSGGSGAAHGGGSRLAEPR